MARDFATAEVIELDGIVPKAGNFMEVPVEEVFDWPNVFERINKGYGWPDHERYMGYLALFRSIRLPGADTDLLQYNDDLAYEEAKASGDLLLYHKGDLGENGECASFCVWRSGEAAYRATRGAAHKAAATLVGRMYKPYYLDLQNVAWQNGVVEFSRPDRAAAHRR
jgi:hypothetical protein